jgi:acetyl esterase/lipase
MKPAPREVAGFSSGKKLKNCPRANTVTSTRPVRNYEDIVWRRRSCRTNIRFLLGEVHTMRAFTPLLALLAALLLVSGARAGEGKNGIKVGGNYEVEVTKNVAYYDGKDADEVRHKLDLYLPKGQKDYPVLLFIHGGGWTKGSKDTAGKFGRTLAKNGIGVVSANYRLSPKVQHPAHIEDVARAFAWVSKNIAKHGGRADQIFVCGHSAGAHLIALLATDDTYLKAHKLSLESIKGAIPVSAPFIVGFKNTKVWGEDEEKAKNASPMKHVKANLPPFLVILADDDLKGFDKQAEAFTKAMTKAKNEATSLTVADRNHGSVMGKMSNEDDPATQALLVFISKHSGLKLTTKAKDSK